MRINVLSHTKAALNDAPNILDEELAETLASVARCVIAELTAEVPDYVTRSEDEEFIVELEIEKAAADQVDLSLYYMRVLGLYTACYYSDGYLNLRAGFHLEL